MNHNAHNRGARLYGLLLAMTLLFGPALSVAQQLLPATDSEGETRPVELTTPLSKETVRDLVSRMSDDAVRALLIERLDAVAEAEAAEADAPSAFDELRDGFGTYWSNATVALTRLERIPGLIDLATTDTAGPRPL